MNTDAILSKIDAFIEFLFFKLVPLIALLPTQIYFIIWVEERWAVGRSFFFAWPVALLYTLPPLLVIAAIFASSLKRKWQASHLEVIAIGTVLLFFGTIGSYTVMTLHKMLNRGRETAAINTLVEIHRAQNEFKAQKNKYATLQELVEEKLLPLNYLNEKGKQGYQYSASDISATTYCIHADRLQNGSGNRDYHITETGDIRFIESRIKGTVPRGQGNQLGAD